jgi:cytochrome c-type biogenesis protein CcmI
MKMKTDRKILPVLVLLAAAIVSFPLLQGCVSSSKVQTVNVSLGQQLEDLKKAHENGTISDKEYERLRKDIMKKYK